MDDKTRSRLAFAAVMVVAGVGAVVSYGHIMSLVLTHGQDRLSSILTPLSVDGMIVASSMALLSRRGVKLARALLIMSIGATVCANAASDLTHGVIGVASAVWPAVAVVGGVELVVAWLRSNAKQTRQAVTPLAQLRDIPAAEAAKLAGVSVRTVQRARAASMNGASS